MGEPTERCRCVADMTKSDAKFSLLLLRENFEGQPCGWCPRVFEISNFLSHTRVIRCERRTNANDRDFDARDARALKKMQQQIERAE